jgi:hypothetical protein
MKTAAETTARVIAGDDTVAVGAGPLVGAVRTDERGVRSVLTVRSPNQRSGRRRRVLPSSGRAGLAGRKTNW